MTDLKQETERLLALADAATPGRWFDHGDTVWAPPDSDDEGSTCVAQECTNDDATFIAAAPDMATHIRALQAEVDRLTAECEALRKTLFSIRVHTGHVKHYPDQLHIDLLAKIGEIVDAAMNRERG